MSDIALPASGVPELPLAERLLGDERLAKLAGKGNARAFGALYSRHHQAIYRYCRSILGNDHDAQDALQSAMMRAYAALARQERDLAVKAWLFRIAHNEAVSILRRRRPEQELASDLESATTEVEGTLETRERLATLVADLRSLPERQRAALVMRELSGLSIREIAAALAISEGAAKQTLFEARTSLHELSEGRAMECEAVRQAVSQRDGRILRGRRLRAHLASCEDCRAFREAIGARQADLRALAPVLPIPAAGAILTRLLPGGGHAAGAAISAGSGAPLAGSSASLATGSGTSLIGHAAASLLVKGVAGVAVIAAATAGTVHFTSGSRPVHRDLGGAPAGHGAGAPGHTEAPLAPGVDGAARANGSQATNGEAPGQAAKGKGPTGVHGAPASSAGPGRHLGLQEDPVGSSRSRSRVSPGMGLRNEGHTDNGSHGRSEANNTSPHRASPHRRSGRGNGGAKRSGGTGLKKSSANHSKKSAPSQPHRPPSTPAPRPTGNATGEVQPPTVTQPRPAKTSTNRT